MGADPVQQIRRPFVEERVEHGLDDGFRAGARIPQHRHGCIHRGNPLRDRVQILGLPVAGAEICPALRTQPGLGDDSLNWEHLAEDGLSKAEHRLRVAFTA